HKVTRIPYPEVLKSCAVASSHEAGSFDDPFFRWGKGDDERNSPPLVFLLVWEGSFIQGGEFVLPVFYRCWCPLEVIAAPGEISPPIVYLDRAALMLYSVAA